MDPLAHWIRSLRSRLGKRPACLPVFYVDGERDGSLHHHLENWHPEIYVSRTAWDRRINDWSKASPYLSHDALHGGGWAIAGSPRHRHDDI